jgi:hypothetical protein
MKTTLSTKIKIPEIPLYDSKVKKTKKQLLNKKTIIIYLNHPFNSWKNVIRTEWCKG